MTDTLKGARLKGGIRPSRKYGENRVCAHKGCHTRLSMYNRREYCFAHAPVRFPRVRGRVVPEST
ncbi:MAG: hypothetical protein GXP34_03980 [Actinobacteria bacterium]|nr:hypothetical protein [Actinomycetota bacterium]